MLKKKLQNNKTFMTGIAVVFYRVCKYYLWSWTIFPVIIIFIGPAGVSEAQTVVKKVMDVFHKIEFPDKKLSG